MPVVKLTEQALARLKRPMRPKSQVVYWCDALPGFGVVVGRRKKTFIAQRDVRGGRRAVRIKLGEAGQMSLRDARGRAQIRLGEMARGLDPRDTPADDSTAASASRGVTLRQALELHVARMEAEEKQPRAIEELRAVVDRYLSDWLDLPLSEISPIMCTERHQLITRRGILRNGRALRGPCGANFAMRSLRSIYNTAKRNYRELPRDHPCEGVAWNRERVRDEYIESKELGHWYQAVQQLRNPIMRDWLLTIAYTGLRKIDAASIRWSDVSFDDCILHRPCPKGGPSRKFDLVVARQVMEIFERRRITNAAVFGDDHGYVFPTRRRVPGELCKSCRGPCRVTHIQNAPKRAALRSPHVLRHTYATIAMGLGVDENCLMKLLNHKPAGITARYDHVDQGRQRRAVQRIADYMAAHMRQSGAIESTSLASTA